MPTKVKVVDYISADDVYQLNDWLRHHPELVVLNIETLPQDEMYKYRMWYYEEIERV